MQNGWKFVKKGEGKNTHRIYPRDDERDDVWRNFASTDDIITEEQ